MGFSDFIGDCFMTAAYMDWNENEALYFLTSLKDFFKMGCIIPEFLMVSKMLINI